MVRQRMRAARDAGFTLIELLIVVVILGILSGIVTAAVSNARDQAVREACKTAATSMLRALDNYYMDNNGSYPTITSGAVAEAAVYPKYLKNKPTQVTAAVSPAASDYYLKTIKTTVSGVDYITVEGYRIASPTAATSNRICQAGYELP